MVKGTNFLVIALFAATQAFQSTYPIPGRFGVICQKSSTIQFYAPGKDGMVSSQPSWSPTFERRMKQRLVEQKQSKTKTSTRRQNTKKGNIVEVHSLQEYKKEVGDERDRMVVVRFSAPWCRACKEMQPLFRRLSNSPISKEHNVKFVDVMVTEDNANLHQGLGVPFTPFCHIYHPEAGLVEELRFTKKRVRDVATILQCYLRGECSDLQLDGETHVYSRPYEC